MRLLSISAALSLATSGVTALGVLKGHAVCVGETLLKGFNYQEGVFGRNQWWTGANMVSALAETMLLVPGFKAKHSGIFADIQQKANGGNFLDGFIDDEGWWAMAFIGAYDVTGNNQFLSTAIGIAQDMKKYPSPCGGGVWWNKQKTYIASIANELYIEVAAALANRVSGSEKDEWINIAQQTWDWFLGIGVVDDSTWYISDGVDHSTCKPTGGPTAYVQGVILGAASELSRATKNTTYITTAAKIADATIKDSSPFVQNGILGDPCDFSENCSGDGEEFKGPFIRNLPKLAHAIGLQTVLGTVLPLQWVSFMQHQANSIWDKARADNSCQLGLYWQGPYKQHDVIAQGIGLDAINAALSTNPTWFGNQTNNRTTTIGRSFRA